MSVISTRKRAANRRNARLSTGPNTLAGKARSSRNSMTHGLFAQDVLVPGEDAGAFRQFRNDMLESLSPRNILEVQLAEQVIAASWRLRRVRAAEAELFEETISELLEETGAGTVLLQLTQSGDPALERLHRYERQLEGSRSRALKQLQELQKKDAPQACEFARALIFQNEPTADAAESKGNGDKQLECVATPAPTVEAFESKATINLHDLNEAVCVNAGEPEAVLASQ